jgi:hypothetical protein
LPLELLTAVDVSIDRVVKGEDDGQDTIEKRPNDDDTPAIDA